MKYELYKDRRGEWRWRLRASNHEIIASGEGYVKRADCVHSIRLVKRSAKTKIVDLVEEAKQAAKIKTAKKKTAKRKTAKRKTAKRKTAKRKTAKRKTRR